MSTTIDRTLTCADCGDGFVFTASEQGFFAERQFTEPRRCPSCRAVRKLSRGGSSEPTPGASYAGSRTMYSGTCSSCGREARVPFQPTGTKPVYCSDCFAPRGASYR